MSVWKNRKRRVRAMWRLLFFVLLVGVVANPLVLLLDATDNPLLERSLENLAAAIGFLAAFLLTIRLMDRRPLADFGLKVGRSWWADLAMGFLVAGVVVTVFFVVQLLAGWVTVRELGRTSLAVPFALAFTGQLVRYAAGSFFEELFSRSFLLRMIAESLRDTLGPRRALIAGWVGTSVLFGGLHAMNPDATLLSTLNLSLIGLFLGWTMVVTGNLALPIGLHLGWNVFQNCVFGFPNGGKESVATILGTESRGPSLWTGGAFGPEGSLLIPGILVLGALLLTPWLTRRHGGVSLRESLAEVPTTPGQE